MVNSILSVRAIGVAVALLAGSVFPVVSHAAIAPGAPVNLNVFGANQNYANTDTLFQNSSYGALIEALGIHNHRYIGGSVSSFWDWQTGKFIPDSEITAIWSSPWFIGNTGWINSRPAGTFTTDTFNTFTNNTNTFPQWTTNMTTRELDQPAMIQHLHDQGYNYDLVEMDNEAYFWGNEYAIGGQAGRNYALRFKPTSQLIRSLNPNTRIAATAREQGIFTNEPLNTGGWNGNWNNELYGQINQPDMAEPMFDAFILHHYLMNSNTLGGYSMANVPSAFLAYPQATLERGAMIMEQHYGDLPVWLTEFNVIAYYQSGGGTQGQWIRDTKNTGWNALYQASFMLTAMAMPDDYTVLNHHEIKGGIGWQLGNPVSTTQGSVNATGQLFAHLSHLARQADTMHAVEPELNPSLGLNIEGQTDIDAFQAVALHNQTDEELVLLVINRDDQTQPFVLADHGGYQDYQMWTYHADDPGANGMKTVALDSIFAATGSAMTPSISSGSINPDTLLLNLPGYSLSIITLTNLTPALVGDLNGDGFVGVADLNLVLGYWNQTSPYWRADPTGDGYVGIDDLNIVLGNWNAGTPPEVQANIPEPATIVMLGAGCLAVMRRRSGDGCRFKCVLR